MATEEDRPIDGFGLIVSPTYWRGRRIYAELFPATPLITWTGFGKYRDSKWYWRNFWPLRRGRSWRKPHIRWWFEVYADEPRLGPNTAWYHDYDGGGTTMARAIINAMDAVSKVTDHLYAEESKKKRKVPVNGKA